MPFLVNSDTGIPGAPSGGGGSSHDHPNLPVLNQFSEDGNGVPGYAGLDLVRVEPDFLQIVVAPDAGSQQPDDWPEVGGQGIISALHHLSRFKVIPGQRLEVLLRKGVYNIEKTVVTPGREGGQRIMLRAIDSPHFPSEGDYSFRNVEDDFTTLRKAYPVRIEFSGWAAFTVSYHGQFTIKNILIECIDKTPRSGFHADFGGHVNIEGCSTIACAAAFAPTRGSTMRVSDGGHFLNPKGRVVSATYASSVTIIGSKDVARTFICAYVTYAFVMSQGTALSMSSYGGNEPILVGNKSYPAFGVFDNSTAYLDRVKIRTCSYNFHVSRGSHLYTNLVEAYGNQSYLSYVAEGSTAYFYSIALNGSAGTTERTFYTRDGGYTYIREAGLSGNAPLFSPAVNVEGNHGAWNREV